MILAQLNEYLHQHGRASLSDMAMAMDSTPEAVEAILGRLERKGRVRRLPEGSTCGSGCCKCDPTQTTLYEWVREDAGQHSGDEKKVFFRTPS
ncbi:FeoC-like transcriptional regulator [Azomonas macrocytogenes]|uniref:Putative transcriptional regulator of viral defense system n=1 Tax=Azomonas macrocytogenes TaxID=69962 RepID=A0A839T3W0_AZOMA|nr:FeoC-like transcriptional regulator [Azomonas macrocytogenes]MBB3103689.1 putative transcriptional regulator of viral defense system [Azomonas macrocytogenes]